MSDHKLKPKPAKPDKGGNAPGQINRAALAKSAKGGNAIVNRSQLAKNRDE